MSINENQTLEFRPDAKELFTPENAKQQVQYIQKIMAGVMQKDQHYGVIPGCGDKPTLLKPGAEKLCMVFRLSATYEIMKINLDRGHREYEVTCTLTDSRSGVVQGQGVGMATSLETKWRYRTAGRACPVCNEETIIKGKEEYGGGWLCFKKKGGCGEKFQDGDKEIEDQKEGRVENDNPADQFNTVLKVAKKRSHVDAVLTVLAASDIFTQDIEDMEIKSTNGSSATDTSNDKKTGDKKSGGKKSSGKKKDEKLEFITEEQGVELVKTAKDKGWSEFGFKELLKEFKIERIDEITVNKLDEITKKLDI